MNFFGDYRRPDMDRTNRSALLKQLAGALANSDRDVVISSEALPGRSNIARFIEALTNLFGGSEVDVELILVCRDHFSWAASIYNQRVKDSFSRERETPDTFLRRSRTEFAYANLIGRLRETGARVKVLNYHPATSLVERFLRHVGFPNDEIPPAEMRNVSLSPKALVATLAANNVATSIEDRERYFTVLRKMRRFFAPSGFIFGPEAALQASWRFNIDRQYLEAELGINLPAEDLGARDGGLYLNERDLAEIRTVTAELGSEGDAIVEFAAGFRRPDI
jgi:hypothetical protein